MKKFNIVNITKTLIAALVFGSVFLAAPNNALAGHLMENEKGVWYQKDDGTYLCNGTFRIGLQDFTIDSDGYIVKDTFVSDNYLKAQRVQSLSELATYRFKDLSICNGRVDATSLEAWNFNDNFISSVTEISPNGFSDQNIECSTNSSGHWIEGYTSDENGERYTNSSEESVIKKYREDMTKITPNYTHGRSVDAISTHERMYNEYMSSTK